MKKSNVCALPTAPSQSNQACVDILRDLLDKAERGELLGGAGVWMTTGRQLIMHTTGEMERSPVFAIGALDCLAAKLRRKALGH